VRPKSAHFNVAALCSRLGAGNGNENVGRFNVPVNESFSMNVSQSFSQLKEEFNVPWKWRASIFTSIIFGEEELVQ